MSAGFLDTLASLLTGRIELTEWSDAWDQPGLAIRVGYRAPRVAEDFPFVALSLLNDRVDLNPHHRTTEIRIVIVCGARVEDLALPAAGLHCVDALDQAVLAAIADLPAVVSPRPGERRLAAMEAALTDFYPQHPNYQTERTYIFRG